MISGVLQSLDILIEQKEAQVIFRHKNPVYVWADEFKVEQVVRNYVNNALNHIDGEKVIEIKITQENDMAKNYRIQYRNADSGGRSATYLGEIL